MRHLIPLFMTCVAASAAEHPRLIFDSDGANMLRERITKAPWNAMYETLVANVDAGDWGQPAAEVSDKEHPYYRTVVAQRSAFLYQMTGDDAYAQKARNMTELVMNDAKYWANGGAFGLRLYWIGARTSLVYDWCYGAPSWDEAFSKKVSSELQRHGMAILKKGGKNQNQSPASNWQGGRWASGGLCLLASDEPLDEKALKQAYGRVERYLIENMGNGNNSRGWNIEGLGYTYFPMGNYVHPFAMAMLNRFPEKDLRKTSNGAKWTLWTVFAAMLAGDEIGRIRPDFGDDNPGTNLEGTAGQAFWWTPEVIHPGIAYWYERTLGSRGDNTWDSTRCGTMWSIIHHPGDAVDETNPLNIPEWREAFIDTGGNGFMTWRNAYQDEHDQIAQLYLKLRGNKGHSGPDALTFRMIGSDTAWATGGGRYGKGNVYWQGMNTVYPGQPEAVTKPNRESGKVIGAPVQYADAGGHIVATIPTNNVHTSKHTRWFAADFSKSGAKACYIIGDTTDNGTHWQLNTFIKNTISGGDNSFTITSPNGATMQGTVLYPTKATIETGTRKRGSAFNRVYEDNGWITVQGGNDFLVVLTVADKGAAHPKASFDGTWGKSPKGTVSVGGFRLEVDGTTLVAE